MKIETVSTESLKPYALNNKKHPLQQVERIALSIERYGFNNPIIIDKNDCVVAGHGRLEAAKMLGLQTVPCVRVSDLTDKQVRAYRILDNKLAEQSEDDLGNLEIEVLDLSLDLDLEEWGIPLTFFFEEEMEEAELPKIEDIKTENPEFSQMTFLLHNTQKDAVEKALRLSRGDSEVNDNRNGNSLFFICQFFLEQQGEG